AVDAARGHIYWSQKGGDNAGKGTIRRAPIALPKGRTPADRGDIETLFSGLPEPIDLDIDPVRRQLYWTDRGDNTVSVAAMDGRRERPVLVGGLGEAIGIALDLPAKRMFYTDLAGQVGTAAIDGSGARTLVRAERGLTGIVLLP